MILLMVLLTIGVIITVSMCIHIQEKDFSDLQKSLFKGEMEIKKSQAKLDALNKYNKKKS